MKKIQLFIILLAAIFFNSCQDVVNVNLNTAPPKLVITASINWQKGTSGNEQKIKLTTTTDYYSTKTPIVSKATVFIKNSTNTIFNFTETPNTGEYICYNFKPKLNETYTLTIISDNQTYTATETLLPVTPITKIDQNNNGGFDSKTIEIKAFFNDPVNEDNFYFYKYSYQNPLLNSYYVGEDTYIQGNEFFSLSQNDELKTGDKITISHYGISKTFFNYLNVIISIAGSNNGAPFQSPPATVRGNIVNKTDFNNFALGYFSISEVDTQNYVIK